MSRLLNMLVAAAILVGSGLAVCAATPSPAKPPTAAPQAKATAPQAKAKYRPFNGTIRTVDIVGNRIVLTGKKAQTFQIIAETRINRNGQPAKLAEVKTGERVGGRARQAASGAWEALTINVKSAGT